MEQMLLEHKRWLAGDRQAKRFNATGVDLEYADFSGLDLRKAVFFRCYLDNADFTGCRLDYADFRRSSLKQCTFKRAQLCGARFRDACLTQANFIEANLDFVDWPLDDNTCDDSIQIDARFAATLLFHVGALAKQHIKLSPEQEAFIAQHVDFIKL